MFHPTYTDARSTFRDMASKQGGVLSSWEVLPPSEEHDEGLTIDVAVFGSGPKALVLSSGLHGVEGFAGSAIQLQMLQQGLPDDVRVVMLHVLNPYGMANIRRVNENNVDLNRNFLAATDEYSGASDGYQKLNNLLNPTHPSGRLEFMLLRTIYQIALRGYNTLKTAVVGGQYDFPKGLFYGGSQLECSAELVIQHLPGLLEGAEKVVHIDFHTGLGKSGTYALLVDTDAGSLDHLRLRDLYGERVQPWSADHGVAYKIRGGLPEAVDRLLGKRVDVITCEFGTMAGLKVIQALRTENQAHHWGGPVEKAKQVLLTAFRPDNPAWEDDILHGGAHVIAQALAQLRA
jgi:hypothetical protein